MQRLFRIKAIGLMAGLILMVAALGVVLISYFLSLDVPETTVAPERSIANTDVNPYGANFFLEREVEPYKREETVKMAAEAGIGWVKQQFVWAEIELQDVNLHDPANWQRSWGKYDEIVALCERYGLQIIARLDHPPAWTRQDNTIPESPPDDLADYADFVYGFVKHYQGRVRYIQIWNEPNIYPEWGDREVDPAGYIEMLKMAYQAAKSADPNVYILSAPLAPTLENFVMRRNLNELVFLEEMYQAGAADYFDILSANAFGFDLPPEDPPSADRLNFQRVALQAEIMARHGDGHKAIWINEYGWNASPNTFAEEALIWKRVTEEQQAEYLVRGIELARREWPWAGVFNIWFFRQVDNYSPDESAYYFRLVDVDFTPRRAYYAVKDAAAGLRVAGPGLLEETDPAVEGAQNWRVVIDPAASGGAYLTSQHPGAGLSFTFSGNSVTLVTRRSPNGGRLVVTLDGRHVADLDLYYPQMERIHVKLADNVGDNHPHTLRLTVSDEVNEASAGRLCVVDAFEVEAASLASFPVLPVVALGLGMTLVSLSLYREITRGSWRRR